MSKTVEDIPRPDFGIYDPDITGKPKLSQFLIFLAGLLAVLYSGYVINSYVLIFQMDPLAIFLNSLILLVESLIAYYSLILLIHFAKSFAPVDAPLRSVIDQEDLQNGDVPFVSILLSAYKEPLNIVKQTVLAALDMNYPRDKYEVVVMEDGRQNSDIEDFCNSAGAQYLTRPNRKDFKAGAVNYALPKLQGDYVLFIDTDHILERNVIINCLQAWREDTIAVQTRVDFVNMLTYLTKISAYLQIQFFSLFERGRRSTGSAVFAGGGALFDRHKLIEQGGMQTLTIADDTDTSFTLAADGHRIEYIDTVGVWALVPWDPLHQIRQIWRWMTGITRSFRARWLKILRGNSNWYTKLDHFSTGFFPTLAVLGWLLGFVIIGMVNIGIPILRANAPSYFPYFYVVPGLVSSMALITGVLALVFDDPHVLYRRNSWWSKITSITGFYFLVLAAQPLLLGAILKGLTGIHVEFNRTPKQKKADDAGLGRIKLQYFFQALLIFVIGCLFTWFALMLEIGDARQVTLLIGAYAGLVPLVIVFLWYWKLEDYLMEVGDISALKFLRDIKFENPSN